MKGWKVVGYFDGEGEFEADAVERLSACAAACLDGLLSRGAGNRLAHLLGHGARGFRDGGVALAECGVTPALALAGSGSLAGSG